MEIRGMVCARQNARHLMHLSTRRHVARIMHHCDCCDTLILPGDFYERTVSLLKCGSYRYVKAHKEHVNPPCIFDPGDDDESSEKDSNVIPFPGNALPLAA